MMAFILILVAIISTLLAIHMLYTNKRQESLFPTSPVIISVQIIGIVYVVEVLVMFILSYIDGHEIILLESFWDALLLSFISAPLIYFLIIKPEIAKQTRNIHLITDNVIDGVITIDEDGIIGYINPVAEKIFGYEANELISTSINILMPEPYDNKHDDYIKNYIRTGDKHIIGIGREVSGKHKSGKRFPIYIGVSEIRSGNKRTFIGVIQDITEQKEAEKEIKRARDMAIEASQAKSEFLANMSHEIRTPMNAILGAGDLLMDSNPAPNQLKYIEILQKSGEHLLNLINDILDLSKIEAGHVDMESIDFNLHEAIEKAQAMMAVRAHTKGLELAYKISSDVPKFLLGDPYRLKQILLNLISNAIKFTNEGEIVIYVKKVPVQENNSRKIEILFEVKDTGIGIPPDKIESIFNNFTQADSSTTRRYGGTGLGLAISKNLCQLMGGRIWVESEVHKGSSFFFTAKFGVVSQSLLNLKGIRALVIDDNTTNRTLLTEELAIWGAIPVEAASGQNGLEKLREAKDKNEPYDLILLDCRMPDMDGFEVAEHIKKETGYSDVTVMMLTSDQREGDIARAKEVGITSYLIKPIKKMELQRTIAEAISHHKNLLPDTNIQKQMPVPIVRELDVPKQKAVLVVDDAEDNRLLIDMYFKKTPYRVDMAENGEIALAKFKHRKYDIIIMDMFMPVMDGFAATRAIREWENNNHLKPLPIIALTASVLKEDLDKTIEVGCDEYLSKPIKKTKLLETIEKLIAK